MFPRILPFIRSTLLSPVAVPNNNAEGIAPASHGIAKLKVPLTCQPQCCFVPFNVVLLVKKLSSLAYASYAMMLQEWREPTLDSYGMLNCVMHQKGNKAELEPWRGFSAKQTDI